jgi:hypothetical protein
LAGAWIASTVPNGNVCKYLFLLGENEHTLRSNTQKVVALGGCSLEINHLQTDGAQHLRDKDPELLELP